MSVLSYAMMILLMLFIDFSLYFKSKKRYIEATVEWFGCMAIVLMLRIGYINDYMALSVALLSIVYFLRLRETRKGLENLLVYSILSDNELEELKSRKRKEE